jgi:hypothetical protein
MAETVFPDYVEAFVRALSRFLNTFDLKLQEVQHERASATQGREYTVDGLNWRTMLVLHRTKDSLERDVGEYRVRVVTELPDEIGRWFVGREEVANQAATLGALVTNEGRAEVVCQSLLQQQNIETTAGITAVAIAHAASSITKSAWDALQQVSTEEVTQLSAWTDLDFEQIHYDYAHLGAGTLSPRGWSINLGGYAILALDAVHNNPYWGGGLLARLRIRQDVFRIGKSEITLNELNNLAFLLDMAPTFGAWCKRDGEFWFVSFAPNFIKGLPSFTDSVIQAASLRARTIRGLVDVAESLRDD